MASGWTSRTAGELVAAQRAGKVSAVELTDAAIARIEKYDADINAVIARDFDRARAAARTADEARASGDDRPLLGVPMTIKDSFNVAGLPTTWGIPAFKDFVPAQDALPVARLKAAGAIVLGKTNVPLGLGDLQTYNDIHGTTRNPWDPDRTPGGSSGGSAAALAAGFGALSLGSDIAGSLRVPAHFTGVYAHKPTFGLVPSRGHTVPPGPALPVERDLTVIGPLARGASDLRLVLDLLAEPDPLTTGTAYRLALPGPRHERIAEFRVLIIEDHPLLPSSAEVRAGLGRVADALANAGARVDRHSPLLPDLGEAARIYLRLLRAAIGGTYPPETYQHYQRIAADLDDTRLTSEFIRGTVLSHRDWLAADNARERHRASWRSLFAEYDVVITPVSPTSAFPHDHSVPQEARQIDIDGAAHDYADQLVWPGLATMPGLPATVVPTGLGASGLPIGVQLVGPMFEDHTTIRLAELLEQEIGGFAPPPMR